MSRTVTVEIDARAYDRQLAENGQDRQLVTCELTLQPDADSHGEALVRALHHGADVAAARLGLLGTLTPPLPVRELLADMQAAIDSDAFYDDPDLLQLARNWVSRLAAAYGLDASR